MKIFLAVMLSAFLIVSCERTPPPKPAGNEGGPPSAAQLAWMLRYEKGDGDWPATGDVEIEDVVAGVSIAKSGQWYLAFDQPYPKQTLSVWVPKTYTRKTKESWFRGLLGERVRVAGRAAAYKGVPEIVVKDLGSIRVIHD